MKIIKKNKINAYLYFHFTLRKFYVKIPKEKFGDKKCIITMISTKI